ncbi:helix-turn-helix domain-containing protein [Dysgonomonas macrotermitis]|uniref:DNA-binding transcriptional regulator, XRE-family HTH domain n=1 Tax=Dysgonomonas macrotermitis TaxID=1346286 RepID=A0A1M4UK69_9BACT|nr:helix-turn-helix transcriptional regulator [Dysgonomonas macrotermitis]SHE57048.1 DNA-binding transcriptional regulator, XRE-family HTH domain [Dysgonomonas macrotermitis]
MKLRIQEVLDQYNISAAELGRRIGVSRASISNTINNGNPGAQMLIKWAEAIGCKISEFFEKPQIEGTTGYIEHNGEVYKINSISDIEKLLDDIKK